MKDKTTTKTVPSALAGAGISPKFEAMIKMLPADLTGYDLGPLFEAAKTVNEAHIARRHEMAWEPNAQTVTRGYNGPLGEDGRAHRRNLEKWKEAVEAKQEAFKSAIERDVQIMSDAEYANPLAKSVREIFKIAFGKEGGTDEENESPFAYLQVGEMRGALAGLRILRAAVDELEVQAKDNLEILADYARRDLEAFEGMTGELEAGEPQKSP